MGVDCLWRILLCLGFLLRTHVCMGDAVNHPLVLYDPPSGGGGSACDTPPIAHCVAYTPCPGNGNGNGNGTTSATPLCAQCVEGYYVDGTGRGCQLCSGVCPHSMGINAGVGAECGVRADRVCGVCIEGQWNDGTHLVCQDCPSTCDPGTGVDGNGPNTGVLCARSRNRVCVPCGFTRYNDGSSLYCHECGECARGLGLPLVEGENGGARVKRSACSCHPCLAGAFWNSGNSSTCKPCSTTCNAGYGVNVALGQPCTPEHDRVCAICRNVNFFNPGGSLFCITCSACPYNAFTKGPCTASRDTLCEPCITFCPPGTGLNGRGGMECAFQEGPGECAPCGASEYGDGSPYCHVCEESCERHTGVNGDGGRPCTPYANRICGACPPGTFNNHLTLECLSPPDPSAQSRTIAAVIGSAAGVAVCGLLTYVCRRRRKRRLKRQQGVVLVELEGDDRAPPAAAVEVADADPDHDHDPDHEARAEGAAVGGGGEGINGHAHAHAHAHADNDAYGHANAHDANGAAHAAGGVGGHHHHLEEQEHGVVALALAMEGAADGAAVGAGVVANGGRVAAVAVAPAAVAAVAPAAAVPAKEGHDDDDDGDGDGGPPRARRRQRFRLPFMQHQEALRAPLLDDEPPDDDDQEPGQSPRAPVRPMFMAGILAPGLAAVAAAQLPPIAVVHRVDVGRAGFHADGDVHVGDVGDVDEPEDEDEDYDNERLQVHAEDEEDARPEGVEVLPHPP